MTTTETTAAEKIKENTFLGLYFPCELKEKVATAAKTADCSMSKWLSRLVKAHFDNLKEEPIQ